MEKSIEELLELIPSEIDYIKVSITLLEAYWKGLEEYLNRDAQPTLKRKTGTCPKCQGTD